MSENENAVFACVPGLSGVESLSKNNMVLSAHKFLKSLGIDDPLLHIAAELEENALKDKYFIDRKLFPNVDFYSGVIYRAMGIPSDMYTVMFVLGRLPGWIAQWREMRLMNEPIGRPRQLYTGPAARKFKSKK